MRPEPRNPLAHIPAAFCSSAMSSHLHLVQSAGGQGLSSRSRIPEPGNAGRGGFVSNGECAGELSKGYGSAGDLNGDGLTDIAAG